MPFWNYSRRPYNWKKPFKINRMDHQNHFCVHLCIWWVFHVSLKVISQPIKSRRIVLQSFLAFRAQGVPLQGPRMWCQPCAQNILSQLSESNKWTKMQPCQEAHDMLERTPALPSCMLTARPLLQIDACHVNLSAQWTLAMCDRKQVWVNIVESHGLSVLLTNTSECSLPVFCETGSWNPCWTIICLFNSSSQVASQEEDNPCHLELILEELRALDHILCTPHKLNLLEQCFLNLWQSRPSGQIIWKTKCV